MLWEAGVQTNMNLVTNKSTFQNENFNLHIFHKGMLYQDYYGLMFSPTKNLVNPPISKEELKGLADFIYKYLENC